MVSITKIEQGAAMFVDREMVPALPKAKGIAFAAFAPFLIKAKVQEFTPLVQTMGLLDGENVDIDTIYTALKSKAQGKWPLELLGFNAKEEDLDKLYRYIKEA